MKEFYSVTKDLSEGIQFKMLTLGYDSAGNLAFYLNPKAKENEDEYYNLENAFEDYDEALAYFLSTVASQLAYHEAQIAMIERAKYLVLEL